MYGALISINEPYDAHRNARALQRPTRVRSFADARLRSSLCQSHAMANTAAVNREHPTADRLAGLAPRRVPHGGG